MVQVIDELEICTDCMFAVEYGCYSEHEQCFNREEFDKRQAEIDKAIESVDGQIVNNTPEDFEAGFSWTPCELCGSTLGGDRYPYSILK